MKLLHTGGGGFAVDVSDCYGGFESGENDNIEALTPLFQLAWNSEKVRILSEDEYQTMLSLLPKDSGVPREYNHMCNPLVGLYKDVERFRKSHEYLHLHQLAMRSYKDDTKDDHPCT
jgi:hypothetical protein